MIYFVPTPIGNLEDITIRALNVLREVDYIACEDTRTSSKLLRHFNIDKKLISYHKFNETERSEEIITLEKKGNSIAIISDAGMPGISDPGNILIKNLIENNIEYTVLPGASASITAIVMSGFNNSQFTFLGFIPNKGTSRNRFIKNIKECKHTQLFYESPHRILRTLEDLSTEIPERKIAIIREISKMYESIQIFMAKDYKDYEVLEKGEIVVVVDVDNVEEEISEEFIEKKMLELLKEGYTKKSAVKQIVKDFDMSKNQVYEISLRL